MRVVVVLHAWRVAGGNMAFAMKLGPILGASGCDTCVCT